MINSTKRALAEARYLLTRDRRLLMRKSLVLDILCGRLIRQVQLAEVSRRFGWHGGLRRSADVFGATICLNPSKRMRYWTGWSLLRERTSTISGFAHRASRSIGRGHTSSACRPGSLISWHGAVTERAGSNRSGDACAVESRML